MDEAFDFADSLVDSVEQSEHVSSVVLSPQQQQPSQHSNQQQQQQSIDPSHSGQVTDGNANLTYSAEMAREAPGHQSEVSQHFDVPMDSEEFVSEEILLIGKHRGRSNPNLNRLRPSSARVIQHPTYSLSTSSPSPLMKSSSAVSGTAIACVLQYLLLNLLIN